MTTATQPRSSSRSALRSDGRYLLIGIWLAGLMLLGVLLSELSGHALPIPRWATALLILILSTIKATLVAMYYMHLRSDRRLLLLVVAAPFVLIGLALSVVLSSRFIHL